MIPSAGKQSGPVRGSPPVTDTPAPGRWWPGPLLLGLLLVAGVAVAVTVGIPQVEEIRGWVSGAGWAGPALFAALYAGLTLTPAPATLLSVGAGLLFGLGAGLAVVMVGAVVSAVGAFTLSRTLGRRAVERVDSDRLRRLDALLRRRGLVAVIGVRLVPLLPFNALNYACGLTSVRITDYVLGTAVGILPGATAYVTIGAYGATPGSVPFLVALGGLGVLTVGGIAVARRRRAPTGRTP